MPETTNQTPGCGTAQPSRIPLEWTFDGDRWTAVTAFGTVSVLRAGSGNLWCTTGPAGVCHELPQKYSTQFNSADEAKVAITGIVHRLAVAAATKHLSWAAAAPPPTVDLDTSIERLVGELCDTYVADPSCPGITVSRLGNGTYYASVCRYTQPYGRGRQLLASATGATVFDAVIEAFGTWEGVASPSPEVGDEVWLVPAGGNEPEKLTVMAKGPHKLVAISHGDKPEVRSVRASDVRRSPAAARRASTRAAARVDADK